MKFHKAERKRGKLRLAIAGPSGSGKTYSALIVAFGLSGQVAMIDTENGSGELYSQLGDYDVLSITAPFTPKKYIEAIKLAEDNNYSVLIIDSLSHAWAGQGGLLDQHGKIADSGKGNTWTAWRKVTPLHNQLVESILQSGCHIIATMRSKQEYIQTEENGKTVIKKVGMNPVQRDGMEYEFTLFFDLSQDHTAFASKDRTSLFDGQYFPLSKETGKTLLAWLESGAPERPSGPTPPKPGSAGPDKGIGDPAGGNGNLKALFAAIAKHSLDQDRYKAYCHQKYGVTSMVDLTRDQLEEQAKILTSLTKPMRLQEFKDVLQNLQGFIPF